MRKIIALITLALAIGLIGYMSFIYYVPFSEGVRSGELIKLSHKGMVVKTWEGEISQGISGAQIFKFSILDGDTQVIEQMKELQGHYVKVNYVEKYKTFFWWGETRYFITSVQAEPSPFTTPK